MKKGWNQLVPPLFFYLSNALPLNPFGAGFIKFSSAGGIALSPQFAPGPSAFFPHPFRTPEAREWA